ncbi:GNAT family N-acetyltransferase [Streptomyces sp. NPDC052721]|uniref:GNAT family N-acetyltransferase n=1 Tax=Streptomyces sp. NPDC052721 TaxID=3154955 RepID=UPI0034296E79
MPEKNSWPIAASLQGERLQLEPLTIEHAEEAVEILNDQRLHEWIGGAPPSREELEQRYRRQVAGHSPDGRQGWLNWMLRERAGGQLVGTVQATLYRPCPDRVEAELAWVVGHAFQGAGYGKEGASVMAAWLRTQGISGCVAHVHPGHGASAGIARALGMKPTDEIHDSEVLWADFDPRERRSEC